MTKQEAKEEAIVTKLVMWFITLGIIAGASFLSYNDGRDAGVEKGRIEGMKMLMREEAKCVLVIEEYACEYKAMSKVQK